MHLTMVNWGVIFSKIISVFVCYFFLIYSQFIKKCFVSQPVPFHIPRFWTFWFHPWVYKYFCRRIVRFEGCCWLLVVQCNLGWSHTNRCCTCVEGATRFSFSWRGENITDCFTLCVYGAISIGVRFYWTWWGPVAEIKVTCITASYLWHGGICRAWIHM